MSASRGITFAPPARRAFVALQAIYPAAAARLVERWFFKPPRVPLRSAARGLLRAGRRFRLTAEGRPVVGWTWGAGPAVYLVHGWGSRAARLSEFVRPLVDAGFLVVAFDGPGHGESGRGLSSIPEFSRALRTVIEHSGPARAIIAHSLGAAAAALAASWGVDAERFVLLAPPSDPVAFAEGFATALGASPDVMARMRSNSERRLRISWSDLDVCSIAARMTAPALVVHDENDDVVPYAEGASIAAAWPGARFFSTNGLSHRGLLRDPAVVAEVVGFVAGSPIGLSEAVVLDHALFYRETRWR